MDESRQAMENRFTVVTPNFNMGRYLATTIESVLENLKPGDEYFIIDGGSTDNSVEVIKQYADRITGWVSEPDSGYADALSKGFSRGTAPNQCWINCGDILLKGSLDIARASLMNTGADMIFGDDVYIDEGDRVLGYSRGVCANLRDAMIFGDWTPLQDACFWRRDLYERVGGLDTGLRNAADYELFAKFATRGRACYVPYAFSAFRRHDGQRSISHSATYQQEKKVTRHRFVAAAQETLAAKCLKRVYYYCAVRWRARVLHRLWDLPQLHGRSAKALPAGRYWPAGISDLKNDSHT